MTTTKTTHRHKAIRERGPYPYFGPVAREQNRAAHGNVRYREECRCGATRDTLVNGRHVERGPWVGPEAEERSEA